MCDTVAKQFAQLLLVAFDADYDNSELATAKLPQSDSSDGGGNVLSSMNVQLESIYPMYHISWLWHELIFFT